MLDYLKKFFYNIYVAAKNMSIFIRLVLLFIIFAIIIIVILANHHMVEFVLIKNFIEVKTSLSFLIIIIGLLTKFFCFVIKFIAKGIFLKKKK
jgi:hypothetical protein